jgi:hypothetical protein
MNTVTAIFHSPVCMGSGFAGSARAPE